MKQELRKHRQVLVAKLAGPPGRPADIDSLRREIEQIPRMLLLRLRSLGDSILTLPLIEALHGWRPDLELDILIEASYAPVFVHHPAIHEILTLRSRPWLASSGWTRLRAAIEIRKRRYPAVLNLHGGTTSMLFTLASGASLRLGQGSHRGSWLYSAQIPSSSSVWRRQSLHTAEHQLTVMRWLELPIPHEPACSLHVDGAARSRVQNRLAQTGITDYFLIQPTATLATKQWRPEYYAQLGDWLRKQHGLPVIYTATPGEISILEQIRKEAKGNPICWSDLPLMDLFALIEGCRVFIGNDSGPTHAASALKKPVVVIWGSSDFLAWRPWGTQYEAVRSGLPCMPCPGYTCKAFGEPKCILDITVASVADACERILARACRDSVPSLRGRSGHV
jgi:ADP-heptose:LPS heptosyltransferase